MRYEFEDVYDLLKAVQSHKLGPKECFVSVNNVTSTEVGFATADTEGPATYWVIPLRAAKESAMSRRSKEGRMIRQLLGSYMGRKELLTEVLAGRIKLNDPVWVEPEPQLVAPEPSGPQQLTIPGL